jgi:uncharacterized phage-associated protein
MYSAESIANYFLDLATASGERLDPIKLQKLIYYAVGWYAGYTGERLIDEEIKAWPSGPIIASVYHAFINFGLDPITSRAIEVEGHSIILVAPPDSKEVQAFLSNVWNAYREYTTRQLSSMAHAIGTPWDRTVQNSHGIQNTSIDFEKIREHFALAAKEANQNSPLLNGGMS